MKYLFIGLFLLPIALIAQSDWAFPTDAQCGKKYCKCYILKHDSLTDNAPLYAVDILSYDSVTFKIQNRQAWKELIHLPVFDTVLLKIPVDKITRMANLPDEYDVIRKYNPSATCFSRWVFHTSTKQGYFRADPAHCIVWSLVEIPLERNFLPTLTLKSTRHQVRVDTADVLVIKQIIERSPIVFEEKEQPEMYETVLIPKARNLVWTEWREDNTEVRISAPLISDIQKALKQRHYYRGKITNDMDERTKNALMKFQKAKGLQMGNLNLETVEALGLKYEF